MKGRVYVPPQDVVLRLEYGRLDPLLRERFGVPLKLRARHHHRHHELRDGDRDLVCNLHVKLEQFGDELRLHVQLDIHPVHAQ